MSEWFGKKCKFQCCQWEENEETGGPDFKESEPCLVFCNHGQNPDNFEGNCNRGLCPLAAAAPDMYEALKELLSVGEVAVHGVSVANLFPAKFKQANEALSKAEGE